MKKRLLSLFLSAVLSFSILGNPTILSAKAAAAPLSPAYSLYFLGLFKGAATNDDGTPVFALDRAPTRAEAVIMLIRLLGKETEAKQGSFKHPFNDVEDWAKPYVGYAYTNGLSNGTSETTYGSNETISAPQFITLVLRALGYKSGSDFQWDTSYKFSDSLGLTNGTYNADTKFLRGDAAAISYNALSQKLKGNTQTLLVNLYVNGIVSAGNIKAAGLESLVKGVPAPKSPFKGEEKAYLNCSSVPNFGAYFDIGYFQTSETTESNFSFYAYTYDKDATLKIDPDAISNYVKLLKKWGFEYTIPSKFTVKDGSVSGDIYYNKDIQILVSTIILTSGRSYIYIFISKNNTESPKYPAKTEIGYEKDTLVPDFGAFSGTIAYITGDVKLSRNYYYRPIDAAMNDPIYLSNYIALLNKWGFKKTLSLDRKVIDATFKGETYKKDSLEIFVGYYEYDQGYKIFCVGIAKSTT